MSKASLIIQPPPSPEKLSQRFSLIGTVDVGSVEVLETLYILPSGCVVDLDFAQVDRVNSMGLAQLLKLFEHWQKQEIKIRISHVNRMIGILFKMTGLTRFLAEELTMEASAPARQQQIISMPQPGQDNGSSLATPKPFAPTELLIQPKPSDSALVQQFVLTGVIDVNAVTVLESMYVIPDSCEVTLDFAQIQRVNSMGLAQLLKLFQNWQPRRVAIKIINTNRMIGVLFKMTGLTAYLSENEGSVARKADAELAKPVVTQPIPSATPTPTPHHRANDNLQSKPASVFKDSAPTGKLNLWVSAQSSQQMNGWYFFNTYLQRHLDREIHMELSHGAMTERRKRIDEMDIVFTKPFEATDLILSHHYQPIMRPIEQTDEVTLLVRSEDPRHNLADFKGGKIVTSAPDNFVYLLGRFLLESSESSLTNMEYVFSGHDIKALQMLLKGSADILFMLTDTYKGLSGLTKKMLREVDRSETAFAFHLFCVAPNCAALGDELSSVLLNMSLDSQGRQVLADLGIPGWIKPTSDECDMLEMLFKKYAITASQQH